MMKRIICVCISLILLAICLPGCESRSDKDTAEDVQIYFENTTLSVAVSETAELGATVLPAGSEVYWYSTDPSVAQCNNGMVLGLKQGHAAIVCYASNGAVASCNVTVTGEPEYIVQHDISEYFDISWSFGNVESLNADTSGLSATSDNLIFNTDQTTVTVSVRPLKEGRYLESKITFQLVFTQDGQIQYLTSGDYKVAMGWQQVAFAIELDESGYGSSTQTISYLNFYNPLTASFEFEAEKPELLPEHVVKVAKGTFYPAE